MAPYKYAYYHYIANVICMIWPVYATSQAILHKLIVIKTNNKQVSNLLLWCDKCTSI